MSRENERSGGGRALDIVLSILLIAAVGAGCAYVGTRAVKIDQTTTYYVPEPTEATEAEPENRYDSVEVMNSEVNSGPLILVNNTIPCQTGEEGLVSLYNHKMELLEAAQQEDPKSFSVRDSDLLVQEPFADAIIAMLNDFNAATGDDNIVVVSGYRSQELQQQLYDQDLAETGLEYSDRVAKPGFSEHQTGLGIDLDLYGDAEYDGTGIYAWIDEHCADYGIVLRYPDGKQDITDIKYEPWHYRYVGKPHAAYMMQSDLVLEEYLQLLKDAYPFDGEHLMVTDTDGKLWEVYYYPADEGFDSTMVSVPSGMAYTISGTNNGGFVVAAETGDISLGEDIPEETPDNAEEITPDADIAQDPETSEVAEQ
ncbi:MAG: D-alanyl-D-alanine carboxypeptidase family protein [Oscillospiraceae bacterium]|nr:D-alanyl-D-alanine carboxypeptidase family protein [Oscillospiraceae bacterium]